MRKVIFLPIAFLAVVAITSVTALAAVNNKAGSPTASFSGATVTVTGGDFSGLGNSPSLATSTATGSATYTCTNPQGHASPGQNPVPAQSGTSGAALDNYCISVVGIGGSCPAPLIDAFPQHLVEVVPRHVVDDVVQQPAAEPRCNQCDAVGPDLPGTVGRRHWFGPTTLPRRP